MAKQPAKRKNTKNVTEATTTEASTPRTLEQRLEAAEALVAKLKQAIASETIKNDIAVGDEVSFTFGRGESKRTLEGSVAGLKDSDQGKIVAITTVDEDGLPDIKRVNIRDLTANATADKRRSDAAEGSTDPLEAE